MADWQRQCRERQQPGGRSALEGGRAHVNPMLALRNLVGDNRWHDGWASIATSLHAKARLAHTSRRRTRPDPAAIPDPVAHPAPDEHRVPVGRHTHHRQTTCGSARPRCQGARPSQPATIRTRVSPTRLVPNGCQERTRRTIYLALATGRGYRCSDHGTPHAVAHRRARADARDRSSDCFTSSSDISA
jgi:hypothetical protein